MPDPDYGKYLNRLNHMRDMCIFCKIAKKEEKAYIIYEDERTMAFLDINPLSKGHTLVIPKDHYETLIEMPQDVIRDIMNTVKEVCRKLNVFRPDGFNIITNIGEVAGQVIKHAHVHVIPRYSDETSKPIEFGKPAKVELEEVYKSLI